MLEGVIAVGFDLDGTLYKSTSEMNDRIRNRIAERILEKKPDLKNVEKARLFFESRYRELESGAMILSEIGFSNASRVMDDCLATADISDLISEDPILARILSDIHNSYELTYLLTSSPESVALEKLRRLGVDADNVFDIKLYSDTNGIGSKRDRSAFSYVVKKTGIPPPNHVYVGDKLTSDIAPAKEMGMKAVAVWSYISEADVSIDHIYKIKEVLLNDR